MFQLSCVNCSYNALQHGSLGTGVGYCAVHRRVLNTPAELTCGRHFRKDLPLAGAVREQEHHAKRFTSQGISLVMTRTPAEAARTSGAESDVKALRRDAVGSEVADYGLLGSKIESLARLSRLPGARADVALSSLSRTYVRRCMDRGGTWTSGLHIFWWIRTRLRDEPEVELSDLRDEAPVPLSRRVDLAKWSVVFLRLTYLSDLGTYASSASPKRRRVKVHKLANLVERAAVETADLSLSKLMRWMRRDGAKLVEDALPEAEYQRLARELHADEA